MVSTYFKITITINRNSNNTADRYPSRFLPQYLLTESFKNKDWCLESGKSYKNTQVDKKKKESPLKTKLEFISDESCISESIERWIFKFLIFTGSLNAKLAQAVTFLPKIKNVLTAWD